MTWVNDAESRKRSDATYNDPAYRRNREAARQRARGFCEDCGHRHGHLECDHDIPVSQGGTHDLANLRMCCKGPGSCKCHDRKTAREGNAGKKAAPAHDPAPRPVTRW
jgi:hypothetical protein